MTHPPDNGLPPVYLITDRKRAAPDLLCALGSALKGGVRMVQLREKDLPRPELKALAEETFKLTRYHGARLLINGDPELAAEIGADGVQLGVHSVPITAARRILGTGALIGYSAHSASEVEVAAEQGADFVTFSPIYFTASKARYGPPQGVQALRDICRRAPIPVYALGGINPERIGELLQAGAGGVALISAILGATDVEQAARNLQRAISSHPAWLRDTP